MKEIVKQVSDDFKISSGEAELIVASLLEQPRFGIYFNNRMDINTKKILNMKLIQLKKGVPIEYITKKIQFRNFLLRIYPGVFIPRLETEYFIELIEKFVNLRPEKILEIGTGSGAICITLATIFPKAKIIATDISQNAINCVLENIERYNLTEQINLLHCNMFEGLTTKFDLIVTNPPYIPRARLKSLPKSVKHFEPILAINGGTEGVQFIKKLIQQGKDYLNPGGLIAIEIDETEVKILQKFVEMNISAPFYFKKDLFGRFRYLFVGNFKNE